MLANAFGMRRTVPPPSCLGLYRYNDGGFLNGARMTSLVLSRRRVAISWAASELMACGAKAAIEVRRSLSCQ
jgi:hypothetical protein